MVTRGPVAADFPSISELLPHAGPMCLLDDVLSHDGAGTHCGVEIRGRSLFAEADGAVPVWVGLEYMAQCMAVHGGLALRARGELPRGGGLLLGSRRLTLHADRFECGTRLVVEASPVQGGRKMVTFDCAVRAAQGGAALAEGRISALLVELPGHAEASERGGP